VLISSSVGILIGSGGNLDLQSADAIPLDKIIILDPGHGGEDSGAVGVNGILEKNINLEIALEMGKYLEEKGYVVVYTRTDDRLLLNEGEDVYGIRKISDLKNRCKVGEKYPGALFISLHTNSFGSEKYSGLQVYYTDDNENSRALADSIQQKVVGDLQKDNKRKVKPGESIYLLDNLNNTAVLIECGFLTNKTECEKLSEKEYKKQLSFSIVCGIIEYIEKNTSN
jgi:N-acetylmuramoyl-L-alanine amidase